MAHTYVINNAFSVGSNCTIVGTVDGFLVTISVPIAQINAASLSSQLQNLIAPLMLLAAQNAGLITPPSVSTVMQLGTFSQ